MAGWQDGDFSSGGIRMDLGRLSIRLGMISCCSFFQHGLSFPTRGASKFHGMMIDMIYWEWVLGIPRAPNTETETGDLEMAFRV